MTRCMLLGHHMRGVEYRLELSRTLSLSGDLDTGMNENWLMHIKWLNVSIYDIEHFYASDVSTEKRYKAFWYVLWCLKHRIGREQFAVFYDASNSEVLENNFLHFMTFQQKNGKEQISC